MPACSRSAAIICRAATPTARVCLIPSSAHGTNPASAAMAGMDVVVVRCLDDGDIDVADLKAKAAQHADQPCRADDHLSLDAWRVRGRRASDICAIVHEHGGQVYLDGANLNALVGLARPGDIGADVCHMNLHKTFCIPHGGGGPGVGPIGVKAHLAPFLPGHVAEGSAHAVAAAPFGSASILPITWMYIRMMGAAGPEAGDRDGDPQRQLHRRAARAALPRALQGPQRPRRA